LKRRGILLYIFWSVDYRCQFNNLRTFHRIILWYFIFVWVGDK
jgi:hypothetical protein